MDREQQRAAVMQVLARLQSVAPGHAVEVRVPPFAAVQILEGPRHTRGTPGAVVELDAATLLALDDGSLSWEDAMRAGRVRASGERSDLRALFPA